MEEKKENEIPHEHHHKKSLTEKIRENPWIIATFVLGILSVILLFTTFFGNITGNTISANSAGEKLLNFYTEMGISGLTIDSVKEVSGLYQVNLIYKEETIPMYMTKDGKNLIPGEALSPLEQISDDQTTQEEVPKSDKPSVELYVFTYCPYGLQMEKAMIPAIKLLGNKIDFRIRQIGAMHGDFEKVEAERQLCIEKEYPEKFLDYVLAFGENTEIGTCSGDATCLAPKLNTLFSKLGIDATKIESCMKSDGETLYNAEVQNAQSKGISGSPGLVINSVQTQSSRSSEAVKGVICSAFNDIPSECSTTLSTEQASAGFGAGTSSGTSASCGA